MKEAVEQLYSLYRLIKYGWKGPKLASTGPRTHEKIVMKESPTHPEGGAVYEYRNKQAWYIQPPLLLVFTLPLRMFYTLAGGRMMVVYGYRVFLSSYDLPTMSSNG